MSLFVSLYHYNILTAKSIKVYFSARIVQDLKETIGYIIF